MHRSFFERAVVRRVCVVIDKRAFCIRVTPVVIIGIAIEGECQVFCQVNIGVTTGNKRVTDCFIRSVFIRKDTVTTYTVSAVQLIEAVIVFIATYLRSPMLIVRVVK